MDRTGLLIAFVLGAGIGLAFGFFPELDLNIAALFFDAEAKQFTLWREVLLGHVSWPAHLRDASMWIVAALAIPPGVALAAKCAWPTTRLWISGRAIIFLLATLALAPGLLVSVVLKEHWDRPRPIAVSEFNGPDQIGRASCRERV